MADLQLSLTSAERDYLVNLLERVHKEKLVEEHRTRTPSYREDIERQEKLILGVLSKLGASAS